MKKRWLGIALVVGIVLSIFTPLPERLSEFLSSRGRTSSGGSCPADAPKANLDFTLKDMNGQDVRLADLRGKVLLLNFWATWCGPCRLEIPSFVEIQQQYRDKGFQAIGVSVDDEASMLPPFAQEFKINYPLLVGKERDDIQQAYGPIFGIPITVIISRDGRVCKKHIGPASREQFESEIKGLL